MFFIIRARKILAICLIFLIGVCTYAGQTIRFNGSTETISNFDIKTIVIDAGHGEPDGGCESANGVKESYLNLQVAIELEEILNQMRI
jgi:N-acetylmuramoyl-L-alanine amidase